MWPKQHLKFRVFLSIFLAHFTLRNWSPPIPGWSNRNWGVADFSHTLIPHMQSVSKSVLAEHSRMWPLLSMATPITNQATIISHADNYCHVPVVLSSSICVPFAIRSQDDLKTKSIGAVMTDLLGKTTSLVGWVKHESSHERLAVLYTDFWRSWASS